MLGTTTAERLWSPACAFDHRAVVAMVVGAVGIIGLSILSTMMLGRLNVIGPTMRQELNRRNVSWLILVPLMVVPVLLGAGPTMAMVFVLALACYREYARAMGLFRFRWLSLAVVVALAAVTFAVVDHWYGLFVALWPLAICILAAVSILPDRPNGYIQRTALAVFAFALLGAGLGHLSYLANDANYRPMVLWLIFSVIVSDVMAYVAGKLFGRRKLCPNTSPNKTIGGAIGSGLFTIAFAAALGGFVFAGQPVGKPIHLLALGLIITLGAQLGDLMISSIKRDLGVKDMGTLLPGHGGLLDRFDSMLLVAPAVFHYIGYLQGIGITQTPRIITG